MVSRVMVHLGQACENDGVGLTAFKQIVWDGHASMEFRASRPRIERDGGITENDGDSALQIDRFLSDWFKK